MTTMNQFTKRVGITADFEQVPGRPDGLMGDSARHYKVTLRILDGALSKSMTLYFSQGPACDTPTVADVLNCIQSDNTGEQTFEEWCGDLGYDTDSRRALATFQACVDQERKATRFLGSEYRRLLNAVEPL